MQCLLKVLRDVVVLYKFRLSSIPGGLRYSNKQSLQFPEIFGFASSNDVQIKLVPVSAMMVFEVVR